MRALLFTTLALLPWKMFADTLASGDVKSLLSGLRAQYGRLPSGTDDVPVLGEFASCEWAGDEILELLIRLCDDGRYLGTRDPLLLDCAVMGLERGLIDALANGDGRTLVLSPSASPSLLEACLLYTSDAADD